MCAEYMGKYPVIFLSFKGVDGLTFEEAQTRVTTIIRTEARRHYELKNSDRLVDEEIAQFAQLLAEETVTQEDIDTFYTLVDHAQKPDYPTEPIEQIIEEEMAAYLDGAIDEKTTAERIQSRAGLYLMEQKVE